MEVEVVGSNCLVSSVGREKVEVDRVRMKKRTLQAVLDQCRRALELLGDSDGDGCTGQGDDDDESDGADDEGADVGKEERARGEGSSSSLSGCCDRETNELRDLIKSRVDCSDFLEKLENAQVFIPQSVAEDVGSWNMVNKNDLWEGDNFDADKEDYVLVRQEDIVDGIASFMAAYLVSLKQTKELTPNQLQEALSRTFSAKKKKGKLRKAWDGSKVIYNVASWGATAIGIYQNPVLFKAASVAFWTSCDVISKLF